MFWLVVLIILMVAASAIVALKMYRPNDYNRLRFLCIHLIKGFFYAYSQFIKYVRCQPTNDNCQDKAALEKKQAEVDVLRRNLQAEQLKSSHLKEELEDKENQLAATLHERDKIERELESLMKVHKRLSNDYKEVCGMFHKLSKDNIADVFCSEFDRTMKIIRQAETHVFDCIGHSNECVYNVNLLQYVRAITVLPLDEVYSWYLTLRAASSLAGVGALDIDSFDDYKSQLHYLRKNAFVRLYRPHISSLLLLMEQTRLLENGNAMGVEITNFIHALASLGISPIYLPTGSIFESDHFDEVHITESSNPKAPTRVVEKVISYGVNSDSLDVTQQKTEIIMNI